MSLFSQIWTVAHCMHSNKAGGVGWALFSDVDEFLQPLRSLGTFLATPLPANMTMRLGDTPVHSYDFASITTAGTKRSSRPVLLRTRRLFFCHILV